jgi:hypothetical protein
MTTLGISQFLLDGMLQAARVAQPWFTYPAIAQIVGD